MKEKLRICCDCPADISHRRSNAKRCEVCVSKKKIIKVTNWRKNNSEKSRAYRVKNAEKLSLAGELYRAKNSERVKELRKIYYNKNAEKIRAKSKIYYQTNSKKVYEQSKRWKEANSEKVVCYQKAHRDKIKIALAILKDIEQHKHMETTQ